MIALRRQILLPSASASRRIVRALALTAGTLVLLAAGGYGYLKATYEAPKLAITKLILEAAEPGSQDVYGTVIRLDRHPAYIVAVSAGEDGEFETVDDLVVLTTPARR